MHITSVGKAVVAAAVGGTLLAALVAVVVVRDVVLWRPKHIAEFEPPVALAKLELQDRSGQPLWRVESTHVRPLEYLDYGRVPPGYVQTFPVNTPPRSLRTGERVRLMYVRTDGGYVRHEGKVVGESAFLGGHYEGGWVKNTGDAVFAPPN